MSTTATFDKRDFFLEVERQMEDLYNFIHETQVKNPTIGGTANRLKQHLMQDIRHVKALTGNTTNIDRAMSEALGTDYVNPLVNGSLNASPDKNIMGIKLADRDRKPADKKDFVPKKDEAARFKAEVTDLYNGFLGMKDKDILNILSKPGGETLIRGVAKMAGVKEWQSRDSSEIDFAFFGDVRAAIEAKAKGNALNATIDDKLKDALDTIEEKEPDEEVVEEEEETPAPKKATKKAPAKKSILDDDDDDV